jgi:hypothetical protein
MKQDAVAEISVEVKTPGGDGADRDAGLPAARQPSELDTSPHAVQFYKSDASLVQEVSAVLGTALAAGNPAIVIASPHTAGDSRTNYRRAA